MVLSTEQEDLQRLAADLFAKESPPDVVRRVAGEEPGYDAALWKRCADLGLLGLEAPEELGGGGQSAVETSLVLAGAGSAVVPGPYMSQSLCVAALNACPGGDRRDGWLSALAGGEVIGVVVPPPLGRDGLAEVRVRAEGSGGAVLSGDAGVVVDAPVASLLIVATEGPDGPVVCGFDGDALGAVSVTPVPMVDVTRRAGRVRFDRVAGASVLAHGDEARGVIDRARQVAAAWIAVDSVAGAAATLERTVEYVSNRKQFGRPIGTFQAVKHRCADMFVWVETARVAAEAAVQRLAGPPDDMTDYWCSAAKAVAAGAYAKVAGSAVQLHGGIGFTWDYDLHLWLKRAKLNESLFGDTEAHRARVARWIWETTHER